MEGVAVLSGAVYGFVLFTQTEDGVRITTDLFKMNIRDGPKKHGFHVHASGDLRRGCESCCKHYNPTGKNHGGLEDSESHAGDLGNLSFDVKGNCKTTFFTKKFTVSEILGRSIVIHQDEDDLGRGGDEESKKTGNSGKRIACAVIGYSEQTC